LISSIGDRQSGAVASQSRPGDNLYTSSVLALRPKTGEMVWHYQFTPNDPFDFDACWELILADIDVRGHETQGDHAAQPQRVSLCLDRTNGNLVAANPYETVNWASRIDKETGRPSRPRSPGRCARARKSRCGRRRAAARIGRMRPSIRKTGLLYAPTMHRGGIYKHLPIKDRVVGQRYQFIENRPIPAAPDSAIGHVDAIDPLTAQPKWRMR